MINKNNYHLSSYGEFRVLPASWAEKLKASVEVDVTLNFDGRFYSQTHQQNAVVLGNRRFLPQFVSPGGDSAYWISEDGQFLVRLSDHWSEAPKRLRVKSCGNIKSCYWILTGMAKPVSGYFRYAAGIVELSTMRHR